jgi:hypothetical protein
VPRPVHNLGIVSNAAYDRPTPGRLLHRDAAPRLHLERAPLLPTEPVLEPVVRFRLYLAAHVSRVTIGLG